MPYQDELLEGEVVSIWAGDLDTTDDLTEYFGQPFEVPLRPLSKSASAATLYRKLPLARRPR